MDSCVIEAFRAARRNHATLYFKDSEDVTFLADWRSARDAATSYFIDTGLIVHLNNVENDLGSTWDAIQDG